MIEKYKNEEVNKIYEIFNQEFYKDDIISEHRYYVERNDLGFGERPFHVLWREIVKLAPQDFKFMEIGVYKGQILSLVKLLADNLGKKIEYIGVTPLTNMGDKYSQYPEDDYAKIITDLFQAFGLDFDIEKNILKGLSNEYTIKEKIKSLGKFDVIYVDGGHDYTCVVSDIMLLDDISKPGSLVVFDDSSYFKGLIQNNQRFSGHLEVSTAVRDFIENNPNFEELICVGHNRLFRRK